VTTRLTLLCHAATPALRAAAFPEDEAIENKSAADAAALVGALPRAKRTLVSPALRAKQTVCAMALDAEETASLRDCDYGRWRGRTLADIAAAEPDAMALWMSDPDAAPHGGESITDLIRRVGAWLDAGGLEGGIIAVTHAAVIRAAVVYVLGAPAQSFWRIDAAPLSWIDLRRDDRRWTLRAATLGK
jgi:broad specificity phosphatase PhoE